MILEQRTKERTKKMSESQLSNDKRGEAPVLDEMKCGLCQSKFESKNLENEFRPSNVLAEVKLTKKRERRRSAMTWKRDRNELRFKIQVEEKDKISEVVT